MQKVATAFKLTRGSTFDDYTVMDRNLAGQQTRGPTSRAWVATRAKLGGTPWDARNGDEFKEVPDNGLKMLRGALKHAAVRLDVVALAEDGSAIAPQPASATRPHRVAPKLGMSGGAKRDRGGGKAASKSK